MASNFSTIGFPFDNEEQFRETMLARAAEAREQIPCAPGQYGIWRSRSGAEIWFHFGQGPDGTTEISGLAPFFEGKSEVPLGLSQTFTKPDDNPFEGILIGYVNPQEGGQDGTYPLAFDAVDFALSSGATIPGVYHARISAFSREVSVYPDADAYHAANNEPDKPAFAAQAFIPIGLFAVDQDGPGADGSNPGPTTTAFFTGKILEHNTFTNEATGNDFEWMLVETLDATIDVLADPAVVTGQIADGAIVKVIAVLFGRLTK